MPARETYRRHGTVLNLDPVRAVAISVAQAAVILRYELADQQGGCGLKRPTQRDNKESARALSNFLLIETHPRAFDPDSVLPNIT
jgi:hypothetical protein